MHRWALAGARTETHPRRAELERGPHGLQNGKVKCFWHHWITGHPECVDITLPHLALTLCTDLLRERGLLWPRGSLKTLSLGLGSPKPGA